MPKKVGNHDCVVAFYDVGKEYDWMANTFRGRPVNIDGETWPSTEHYFQAQKYPGNTPAEIDYRRQIREYSGSVSQFPQFAKGLAVGPGAIAGLPAFDGAAWDGNPPALDGRSHEVMRKAVKAKMDQHPDLAAQLDALPDDAIIVEATGNDNKWADGNDGSGTNHLGIIYKELQQERKGVPQAQARQQAYDGYQAFNAERQGRSLYDFPDNPLPAQQQVPPAQQPVPPGQQPPAQQQPAPEEEAQKEEVKKQEEAKRKAEQKKHEAMEFAKLYSEKNATWKRGGWKLMGDQKAFEKGRKKDSKTPNLSSGGAGDNLDFKPGFYEYQGKNAAGKETNFHVYFDGKSASPVPETPFTREKHSACIDFIAGTQGKKTITFDVPAFDKEAFGTQASYDSYCKKLLQQHIDLCREKGLGVEFGPATVEFLKTLSPGERKRFLDQKAALDVIREKKDVLLEADNNRDLDSSAKEIEKTKERDFDATQPNVYVDRVLAGAGDDVDKKLKAVDDELNKVESGLDKVDDGHDKFASKMTAQEELLKKPEDTPVFIKLYFTPSEAEKIKIKFGNAEKIISALEKKWKDPANETKLNKHLQTIESKNEQLSQINQVWKNKLGALKTELAQVVDPARRAEIEAKVKKVEARIERIEGMQGKLDAQKQKIIDLKERYAGRMDLIAQAREDLKQRKEEAQKTKPKI